MIAGRAFAGFPPAMTTMRLVSQGQSTVARSRSWQRPRQTETEKTYKNWNRQEVAEWLIEQANRTHTVSLGG